MSITTTNSKIICYALENQLSWILSYAGEAVVRQSGLDKEVYTIFCNKVPGICNEFPAQKISKFEGRLYVDFTMNK